jgi:hypothetical protein
VLQERVHQGAFACPARRACSTTGSSLSFAFCGALGRKSLIPPQSEGGAHLAKIQAEELLDVVLGATA